MVAEAVHEDDFSFRFTFGLCGLLDFVSVGFEAVCLVGR